MPRPRLGPQKPRTMKQVLKDNGLVDTGRGKGSHSLMAHPREANMRATVPDYPQIDARLAAKIIRQSGKTIDEYLAHL